MNLVMFDIDGTLTKSYEYDQEIFARAISDVTGVEFSDTEWHSYAYITSSGVTPEAICRATGRTATNSQVKEVELRVLTYLEQRLHNSPSDFMEVPGASMFIKRLRNLDNTAIAIATGCWHSEAMFKLGASALDIRGITLATGDDNKSREEIMTISAERALTASGVSQFESIVYFGDGIWDLEASRSLDYGFVGIGEHLNALRNAGAELCHEDYTNLDEVLSSLTEVFGAMSGVNA
jgi:phosphoglycolate phosphatase-like HAD superfamily hydrolase